MNARGRAAVIAFAVTAAGGVPRILLAAGSLPDVLRPFTWSDPLFVYERGLSGHRLPYVDAPFEYPPLIGAVSAIFSLATGPLGFVIAWVLVVSLAAAWCAALLASEGGRWRAWALAPQLFLLGTVNFDVVPAALATAAIVALRRGRERTGAAALALGTLAKLYPLASAPLAVLRARAPVRFVLTFLLILLAGYVPAALQRYSGAAGISFYAVGIPSNIDSVWGLAERLLRALGVDGAATIILATSLAGMAATYLFMTLPRGRRAQDPAAAFALATLTLLLWSRLYSPQYSLWILPFFSLLGLGTPSYVLLTFADVGVFFTIYPLTLVPWSAGDAAPILLLAGLTGFVLLRHFALWRMWRAVGRIELGRGGAGDKGDDREREREHERHGAERAAQEAT